MAVKVPVTLSPVDTKKVDAALARIQSQAKGVNFGGGARSLEKLSRPLGKITGQASEFQKSLEASNARVLAFGASVAVINKLSQAFGALVSNTIKVEASFAKINTILGGTEKQLRQFGDGIFRVAQNTATSFDQVAEGALELARQGLSVEESLSRVETALKLVRVAGIDSQEAVAGLTAAIKGFEGAGLTVANIADKLAEVDTKFAVSTEDLINGLERASASARVAGVSFDELLGLITTVQERTQRGGAVIGNAFKTIFARLGRVDTLQALEQLGISTLDASGNVRGAIPLFQELAKELDGLGLKSVEAGEIIQRVAGVRQRDILISLVEDLNSSQSQFAKSLQVSAGAAGALDAKNESLNNTLEALINNLTVGAQKLSSVLGELGFSEAAGDILKGLSSVVNGITDLLQGEGAGAKFAQGIVKGIGSVLTGPGLALISAIFIKLFIDLAKFGSTSLKSLLGINKAAEQQKVLQQSVLQTLLQNENIQREILALEGNKIAQEQLLLRIYNQQAAALARVQKAAATVTPGLFGAGFRGGERGVGRTGRGASGYVAAEARDVSRGVGGATGGSKVVSIPNFAFGGGKRGTMVANTSEYYVPNYSGGGDAIFNRDMVKSIGLPSGARKLNAAGGYIPNFARKNVGNFGFLVPEMGALRPLKDFNVSLGGKKTTLTGVTVRGIRPGQAKTVSDPIESRIRKSVINSSTKYANELQPLGRSVSQADIEKGFGTIAGAKGALQGAIGSAFEVGISTALDYKAAIREKGGDFDIRGGVNLARIRKLFGMPNSMSIADLKVSDSVGNTESFYSKVMKEIGAGPFGPREEKANARRLAQQQLRAKYPAFYTTKGILKTRGISASDRRRMQTLENRTTDKILRSRFGNAASGYIPNFASALDEAIARESAAGVPINQIRINQSGKLRNAQNPEGLAVTNTRDEPTGRIPNFFQGGVLTTAESVRRTGVSGTVDLRGSSGSSSSRGSGDGGSGAIFALFALQAAVGGLTNTMDQNNKTAQNFGDGLSSLINTLIILQAVGLGPKGLGSFTGLGKLGDKIKGGFAGVQRFLGPVALGLGALDAVLKAGGTGGIVETFKTLKSGLTGEAFDDAREAPQRRALSKVRTGEGFGGETPIQDRIRFAQGQIKIAEKTIASDKDFSFANFDISKSLFTNIIEAQAADIDQDEQKRIIKRFQAEIERLKPQAQAEFQQAVEFRTGKRITAPQADTLAQGFFARRETNISIAAATLNLEQQKKLLTEIDLIEKDRIQSQIQSNELTAEIAIARNDNLEKITSELIETKKVGGVEKAKLETVLQNLSFKKDEVTQVQEIATALGIEKDIAATILETARASNAVLTEDERRKREILKLTQQQSAAEAKVAEARRKGNQFIEGERVQAAANVEMNEIQRTSENRKLDLELRAIGGVSPERRREIEFLKTENDLEGELFALRQQAALSKDILDQKSADVDNKRLARSSAEYRQAVLRNMLDRERLNELEPLIQKELELAEARSKQTGFQRGIEKLDQEIANFGDQLGEQIPDRFANNLGQAMTDALSGAKDLDDALSDAGRNFLGFIRDAFLQQAANQVTSGLMSGLSGFGGAFSSALGGGSSGSGGGFFSRIFGGSMRGGLIKGFNRGGAVGSDVVPAMLTPGEFIMSRDAVNKYGLPMLTKMNEGVMSMAKMQNGGVLGSVMPALSGFMSGAAGTSSQVSNNSEFTFNIQGGTAQQEQGGQQESLQQREFAKRIRSAVTTIVAEESRRGGSLSYLF